ncbi:hypothetical protein EON62_01665, partial [archaeon]
MNVFMERGASIPSVRVAELERLVFDTLLRFAHHMTVGIAVTPHGHAHVSGSHSSSASVTATSVAPPNATASVASGAAAGARARGAGASAAEDKLSDVMAGSVMCLAPARQQ